MALEIPQFYMIDFIPQSKLKSPDLSYKKVLDFGIIL